MEHVSKEQAAADEFARRQEGEKLANSLTWTLALMFLIPVGLLVLGLLAFIISVGLNMSS